MKRFSKSSKLLSVLLAATLVLAGCNNDSGDTKKTTEGSDEEVEQTSEKEEEPSEDKEESEEGETGEQRVLKVDSFSGGNGPEAFKALKESFEDKYPDIKVELRFERELDAVLNKENATGQYSDVVYYNLGQASAYTETQLNNGEVLPINDVYDAISDRMDDSFKDTPIGNYFGDGTQYLLPIKYTPAGLFYNTELIGEGKTYELPETWDDMWKLGEECVKDGRYLFTYPHNGYFDTVLQGLLDEAGGSDFLGKAMSYADGTWESDEGKLVLDTLGKLVSADNEFLHPDTVANANAKDGFKLNQQLVIDDKALFMPNGDWIVGEMAETTPEEGFHWGVMPLPAFEEGGERVSTAFTEQAWIPKQAPNPDDAKLFLEYIYSEEGTKIMVDNGFVVPVKGVNDLITDEYKQEFFSIYQLDNVRASIGAFAPYDTASVPNVDFAAQVYDPIDQIATGNMTVDQWQKQLTELWTTLREHPIAE